MTTSDKAAYLAKLREDWQQVIKGEGGRCPCCQRWGKIYLRKINNSMARSLIWLCNTPLNEAGWVDIPRTAPRWLVRTNQLPTLRWWDLVERHVAGDKKVKHSGFWRPTGKGKAFVEGLIKMPVGVWTYDATVVKYTDEMVSIKECLDEDFSYEEVMVTSMQHEPSS